MGDVLVAGIAPTSDAAELERILVKCASLDTNRFAVVTKAQMTRAHDQSPINFVSAPQAGLSTGSDGTGVPGVGGGRMSLSQFVGAGANVPNYLANFPINVDVAQNYNIAVDEGRSVVTFRAHDDEADGVAAQFRDCGLRNVKIFRPRGTTQGSIPTA
ncbi:MAG: hypothetical protein JO165_09670 [Candidatus Eremiobacteraeota bacterium]|nr:hypothetical protein [Candidatus Eremiobacteraeota bacterium]